MTGPQNNPGRVAYS